MISSRDIISREFTVTSNGYSVQEVKSVLAEAAETIEAYRNENDDLYHKMEVLANKIEEYRLEENAIKTALVTAEKMAEKIKKDSSDASAQLIAKSEETAKNTIDEANAQADKIVSEARDYSSSLLKEKTQEAQNLVLDAKNKANEAINSAKIVAQNILDQAKEISDDLILKSKQEKEAYDILISSLKSDAGEFIGKLIELYSQQIEALGNANLETSSSADDNESQVNELDSDIASLIEEISEIESAIPESVAADESEEETEVPEAQETEELANDTSAEDTEVIEEIRLDEPVEEPTEAEPEELEFEFEIIDEDDAAGDETTDPMAAVEAFSADEITPLDSNAPAIPEINEEAQMEESLFDSEDAQLPFESYFNINREDVHSDKSQTISLVPPEDDDEPKFKGFFKKKK